VIYSELMTDTGVFVISLDLELFWGMHDLFDDAVEYGDNLNGAWEAIPRLLDVFDDSGIRATWATVGFLFARNPQELAALRPDVLPAYANSRRSPYPLLDRLVASGEIDRFHYGWPLVEMVAARPTQELATHTLSHYWALEPGASVEAFKHEMNLAVKAASERGLAYRSIVFPRNHIEPTHIATLPHYGIKAFRGNQAQFMHQPFHPQPQRTVARGMKLIDTYVPLTRAAGYPVPLPTLEGVVDVPASRFLRPYAPSRKGLESLRIRRIRSEMTAAAEAGEMYHLWWHPHNFGKHIEENFSVLEDILETYRRLKDQHGLESMTMAEAAAHLGPSPGSA
jgi:peptidoglycan/xylan/chitin deacetylase (PgdA/CDA1 family)